MMRIVPLINLFKYYKGLPEQDEAIQKLQYLINQKDTSILTTDNDWYDAWVGNNLKKDQFNNSWQGIYNCAKEAGAKFPEVVAAQWALESAWGKHTSGKNNFFGIKGEGTVKTTWEDYGNGPVTIEAEFKDYDTPYDCVNDLVTKWYKDYKMFSGVNRATSAENCAHLLKAEGYATDPIYASKLIDIMERKHII